LAALLGFGTAEHTEDRLEILVRQPRSYPRESDYMRHIVLNRAPGWGLTQSVWMKVGQLMLLSSQPRLAV
jgi:hypothetical protein